MSRSHHIMAMLPLLSILSMSPMEIQSRFISRSIASEIEIPFPKYESRSAKIDRSQVMVDPELDITCFSEKADAYRNSLLEERKNYKVDEVRKDEVAAQKRRLETLVHGMVEVEVLFKALQEKKGYENNAEGEKIALNSIKELKITLESLLQDEIENELAVLKEEQRIKDEESQVADSDAADEPKPTAEEERICELEEKNKVLTQQVEDLLKEQKKILDTMVGVTQMMVQMNQRQQQSYFPQLPQYITGPLVNASLMYPTVTTQANGGNWVFYANGFNPNQMNQQAQVQQQQSPLELGSNVYGSYGQTPNYTLPQLDYMNPLMDPRMGDPRYMIQDHYPGNFGDAAFMYNFGQGPHNIQPVNPLPILA